MRPITSTLARALERSPNAVTYVLSREVAGLFEGLHLLETTIHLFDPIEFAEEGQCALFVADDAYSVLETFWSGRGLKPRASPVTGCFQALWQGHALWLLRVDLTSPCETRWYLAAESVHVAEDFFAAVCDWNNEVRGDILVFKHGHWYRDKQLSDQIAASRLEDLVAPPGFIEALVRETEGFFECEELYARHRIAWKRGVLMLGPPGNGKTHAIKALIQRMGRPTLYVRNLESEHFTLHRSIEWVFERARQTSPCVMIFEDLDSMVTPATRSAFLNELDGFASNHGILILATANFPEKLDPAILERPSRFDRKVTFALPALAERRAFLARQVAGWDEALQIAEPAIDELAQATEGYSFAYLKELCVAGLMAWMATGGDMASVLRSQVETLRSQMQSEPSAEPSEEEDEV